MSGVKPEDAGLRTQTQEADDGELNHKLPPHSRDVCYLALTLPFSHSRGARVALLTGTPGVGPRQTSCFCNFQLLRAAGIAASVPLVRYSFTEQIG